MNNKRTSKILAITGLMLLGTLTPYASAFADNVPQIMVKVDVQKLSSGYRVSKITGSNVVNDEGETIGKIDELIVSPDDNKSAYVILSVGGWLGMGTRLIALPYDNLRISNTRILLPGATKDGLKNLPEFKYSTN